jgi:uncharacterized protein (DUF488 family)
MRTTLYTVGHSNRPLDALLLLLQEAAIGCLVDVRAVPSSRRHPHFARAALAAALASQRIAYLWAGAALGGFRQPRPHSPHVALVEAWRGFADRMDTDVFRNALEKLLADAHDMRTAIMCAEKHPPDCHRSLIADALVARGVRVIHLIDAGQSKPAELDRRARVTDVGLVYDRGAQDSLL